MNKEYTIQSLLANAVDQIDLDVHLRSYSGRCMYEKYCPGITGYHEDLKAVIAEAINILITDVSDEQMNERDAHNIVRDIMGYSEDSMGRGSVYYWNTIRWDESLDEGDEE